MLRMYDQIALGFLMENHFDISSFTIGLVFGTIFGWHTDEACD